jgi:hypothetical protein
LLSIVKRHDDLLQNRTYMGLPVGAKAGQVFQEGWNGRMVTSFTDPSTAWKAGLPEGKGATLGRGFSGSPSRTRSSILRPNAKSTIWDFLTRVSPDYS